MADMHSPEKTKKATLKLNTLVLSLVSFIIIAFTWFSFNIRTSKGSGLILDTIRISFVSITIGVLTSIFIANRHRMGAVVRPNKGRIIASFFMMCLTPLLIYEGLPAPYVMAIFDVDFYSDSGFFLQAALVFAAWYPISCLIISGIHSHGLRVALFSLVWWGLYSGATLVWGIEEVNLSF